MSDLPAGLVSPGMARRDWLNLLVQFGPVHLWANCRALLTGITKNRTLRHPRLQRFFGVDRDAGRYGRVAHKGLARHIGGRLFFGVLAVPATLLFYLPYCFVTTVAEIVSTSAPIDHDLVEPKQPGQRKDLKAGILAGRAAVQQGMDAHDQMRAQLEVTPVDPATQQFRRVAVPCVDPVVRERRTAAAVKAAAQTRAAAAQAFAQRETAGGMGLGR